MMILVLHSTPETALFLRVKLMNDFFTASYEVTSLGYRMFQQNIWKYFSFSTTKLRVSDVKLGMQAGYNGYSFKC